MNQFKTLGALNGYTEKFKDRFQKDELVYVQEEQKCYIWHDKWEEVTVDAETAGVSITAFELNSQIMAQLPSHTLEQKEEDIKLINDFYQLKQSEYFMLLCKEESYFTVFTTFGNPDEKEFEVLGSAVFACLEPIGEVRSVENIDDNEIEIWVYDTHEERMWCLHLFDYQYGVVTFGYGV